MKTIQTATFIAVNKPLAIKQSGLSLLEVLFFVAMAGILYTTVVRLVPPKKTTRNIDDVVLGLNSLAFLAAQENLRKGARTELEFKPSKTNTLQVRAKILQKQKNSQELMFDSITNGFISAKMALPKAVFINDWQIGTKKKGVEDRGFVIPFLNQAITMPCIIHLTAQDSSGVTQKFSLIFNPISCQFKLGSGWTEFINEDDYEP